MVAAMTDDQRASLAARLSAHLHEHPPTGFTLRLDGLDAIERGVRARFVTDQPMSPTDLRLPDAVNKALRAVLSGDETLHGLRVEVRVDVEV